MTERECIIWTENGVWLQTFDSDGRMRLCDCGRITLDSVEAFARAKGLVLDIRRQREQLRGAKAAPVGALEPARV